MSRQPPQRLFEKCLICGEDYSEARAPKNSMARHLRHQHPEVKGKFDTDSWKQEVVKERTQLERRELIDPGS